MNQERGQTLKERTHMHVHTLTHSFTPSLLHSLTSSLLHSLFHSPPLMIVRCCPLQNEPRKPIPSWAQERSLRSALLRQHNAGENPYLIFPPDDFAPIKLSELFPNHSKPRCVWFACVGLRWLAFRLVCWLAFCLE